jgi:prepilin signal peptidase PulO-like enzyme (type II secretory pathway)
MPTTFIILTFILGAIIGSFINVVAFRYNTGLGIRGRSKCMTCGKNLTWSELVPIVSFFLQRGKCRKCKAKISWQYPLVELIAGVIFVLIIWMFPPMSPTDAIDTIFHLLIASILLVACIYDIRHKIIPDGLSYLFSALALIYLIFIAEPTLWSLLAGPILALPFALIWLFSKGEWMGLGDAKLILGIGWTLGLTLGLSAVILAFWIGALCSVIYLIMIKGKIKPRYEVPFGPYLILGMYIVLFTGIEIIDVRDLVDAIAMI